MRALLSKQINAAVGKMGQLLCEWVLIRLNLTLSHPLSLSCTHMFSLTHVLTQQEGAHQMQEMLLDFPTSRTENQINSFVCKLPNIWHFVVATQNRVVTAITVVYNGQLKREIYPISFRWQNPKLACCSRLYRRILASVCRTQLVFAGKPWCSLICQLHGHLFPVCLHIIFPLSVCPNFSFLCWFYVFMLCQS